MLGRPHFARHGRGRGGFAVAQHAGSHAADSGISFRVISTRGGVEARETPLMRDRVDAVVAGGDTLTLELRASGSIPYTQIRAFN